MTEPARRELVMDLSGSARSRYSVGIRIGVEIALIVVMALAVHTSAGFPQVAAVFPLTATLAALALAIANLAVDLRGVAARHRSAERKNLDGYTQDTAQADAQFRRAGYYIIWIVGLIATMRVLGALIGGAVFLAVILRLEAKWRWWQVLVGTAITFALLYELHTELNLELPSGLINILE